MGCKGLNFLMCTVCSKFDVLQSIFSIFFLYFNIYIFVIDGMGCLLTVLISILRIVAGLTQRERCSSWELAACWRPSASAPLASPPGTVLGFRRGAGLLERFAQRVYPGEGSRKRLQEYLYFSLASDICYNSYFIPKKKWKMQLIRVAEKENKGWQLLLQGFTQHVQSILGSKALRLQKERLREVWLLLVVLRNSREVFRA